jgi:hypothetical protein
VGAALAGLARLALAVHIVKPETVIAWHRRGFRSGSHLLELAEAAR